MFSLLQGLWQYLFKKNEYRCLIVGLDAAGKSTLLERMKAIYDRPERALPPEKIAPTVGLNIGRLDVEGCKLLIWDLGGQRQLQAIWQKYYSQTHAIIFVVDGTDRDRFPEARQCLERVATDPALSDVPILLYVNKQDRPRCLTASEAVALLDLDLLVLKRPCRALALSAITGDGVTEGISWLIGYLRGYARKINS